MMVDMLSVMVVLFRVKTLNVFVEKVLVEIDVKLLIINSISYTCYSFLQGFLKSGRTSDRCLPIDELFKETFVQWDALRRIKYYHLPCQRELFNLSSFIDDVHLINLVKNVRQIVSNLKGK